jgi:ADP-dependent NAD(P)H-hydrate dehydratase / NAD(P)H-hydrate epimerase
MKIFRCDQIKKIDDYTVKHEPITSIDLMERAAGQLLNWIRERYRRSDRFRIFVGPGNNGGDGLALARMLYTSRYVVELYYIEFTDKTSGLWELNRHRLKSETNLELKCISSIDDFPLIDSDEIIIDAIFGSGLTRPVEGLPGQIIERINQTGAIVIAVDIPSGLSGEDNSSNNPEHIIKAAITLSFQFPKLAFMFAENSQYTGDWIALPIGLNDKVINDTESPYRYSENSDIEQLIRKRNKFDHKGIFGHGLLISGSEGKMGAAVLGAKAAIRTGIGLMTCHVPSCGNVILQSSVPEAMAIPDKSLFCISEIGTIESYSAVGIGPGIGTAPETQQALHNLVFECKKPIVIDADALNILAINKHWLKLLHPFTILTPHPKEFERLTCKADSGYERLLKQIEFSKEYACIIVLKGAHTSVTTPDGRVFFNSTGNPGMATGGSGDVLTGIILSLLAQGYSPENAAVAGVYLHGCAGDIAADESCYESMNASDIINSIGKAFIKIWHNGTMAQGHKGATE